MAQARSSLHRRLRIVFGVVSHEVAAAIERPAALRHLAVHRPCGEIERSGNRYSISFVRRVRTRKSASRMLASAASIRPVTGPACANRRSRKSGNAGQRATVHATERSCNPPAAARTSSGIVSSGLRARMPQIRSWISCWGTAGCRLRPADRLDDVGARAFETRSNSRPLASTRSIGPASGSSSPHRQRGRCRAKVPACGARVDAQQ